MTVHTVVDDQGNVIHSTTSADNAALVHEAYNRVAKLDDEIPTVRIESVDIPDSEITNLLGGPPRRCK